MKTLKTTKKAAPKKKVLSKKNLGGTSSPGDVYNMVEKKYKSKYYTPDNVYKGDPNRKKQVDAMIKKQIKTEFDYRTRGGVGKGVSAAIKSKKS